MDQFQAAISAIGKRLEDKHSAMDNRQKRKKGSGENATVKAAQAISADVFDHTLTDQEKAWAGPAVHYSTGAVLGAGYGMLAGAAQVNIGRASGYGAAVWLVADELAVPRLDLGPPPNQTPVSSHIKALFSHLIFGVVTHGVRNLVLS